MAALKHKEQSLISLDGRHVEQRKSILKDQLKLAKKIKTR